MIVLLDNYDSFTYNLYQYIGELYPDIQVIRNDVITVEGLEQLKPEALIVSPGPGYPKDAGISLEAIRHFSGKIPILGVCLGHQSIAEAFGGKIVKASVLMHGKASKIRFQQDSLSERCNLVPAFAGRSAMWPLPLFDRRGCICTGVSVGNCTGYRWANYGIGTQGAADLRRAVPPGIHPDTGRKTDFD